MRLPVPALALLAVPLAATACGGGGGGGGATTAAGSSASAVRAAIAKTAAADREHVALTATVKAAGQDASLSGGGDFDRTQHLGELHVSLGLGGVQTALDEVLRGTTIYASSPLFSAVIGGKKWLVVDLQNPPKWLGAGATALASQDPSAALAQLAGLTGLKEVGSATIGGVDATRYRGTIDVSKLPAASAAIVKTSGATFGPVDVWVGSDGFVHRLRVPTSASADGQKVKTVVTMTLSKFGEPVSVTLPPASETVDARTVSIPGLGG